MGMDDANAMQTDLENLADAVNKVNGSLKDTLKMPWPPLPPPEMLNQQQEEAQKMASLYDDTSEDAADESYYLTPQDLRSEPGKETKMTEDKTK